MNRFLLTAALAATAISTAPAADPALTLEKISVHDPMVSNMLAGTLFKPTGWKLAGGMKWYPDYYHQVCFEARIFDPNSMEQYEAFHWVSCTWLSKPIFAMKEGQNYMGSIVMKPRTPQEVVEEFTIPTVRKGAHVVGHYPMKEIAELFEKSTGCKVRAVRTRIAYSMGNQAVEEDIYLILGYTSADIGGGNISTIWQPVVPPFGLRAAKGQLDAATPKLLTIAHSGWVNPKWADQVGVVKAMFSKRMYSAIEDAGKISRQISANNDHMLGIMRASREAKNASEDRISKNFSDYIRGVTTYSGGGANYTLPNTYSYAWADGRGNVVMTDDATYHPPGWTQLTPSR
jgi:hypothetical protein